MVALLKAAWCRKPKGKQSMVAGTTQYFNYCNCFTQNHNAALPDTDIEPINTHHNTQCNPLSHNQTTTGLGTTPAWIGLFQTHLSISKNTCLSMWVFPMTHINQKCTCESHTHKTCLS